VEPDALTRDFRQVASIAGVGVTDGAIEVESSLAPHQPPTFLPRGKMAVYVFMWGERCLKVGKVGAKSQARYTSQHYSPGSSNSNLAKSLLASRERLGLQHLSDATVGAWIKTNVDRHNFLLDETTGIPVLTLLEAFLQCRLRPLFEGFESQK
jgi:hypothetical protein